MGKNNFEPGDKVTYVTDYGRMENGIVKVTARQNLLNQSITDEQMPDDVDESVFVVYNCGGDWDNYKNYTSAKTNVRDLLHGWRSPSE